MLGSILETTKSPREREREHLHSLNERKKEMGRERERENSKAKQKREGERDWTSVQNVTFGRCLYCIAQMVRCVF